MLGGSYKRKADGSLTLLQRTLETDEAKAVQAALDGSSSSPEAEAEGTAASAQPELTPPAKPKKGA